MDHSVESFAQLLQYSVSPIVLISGVGLLLLSLTNRLARTIDRCRMLVQEIEHGRGGEGERLQLRIMLRRSEVLKWAILWVSASIFFSATMVLLMFCMAFLQWEIHLLAVGVFFCSIACLVISVGFFIADITQTLHALRLEVAAHLHAPEP